MDVAQVNGHVIGELSRLVKRVGEQQREIVLELSKELGKHNKLIEKAMAKEDRLLAKVNRIEEKMMQKEIYNYTFIQGQIKKRKEMAAQAALRNKEEEENMVPAIFQEMEKAEDSEGFDSCDDEEQPNESKRTGNPFQDFNLDIATIEKDDPDLAMTLRIGRKILVDFIESGSDTDFERWKKYKTVGGGASKFSVSAWTPAKAGANVEMRLCITVPNCTLDDLLPYLETDKRLEFDESIQVLEIKKELPLDTKQVHINMKVQWPLGARDMLVNQQLIRYQDKAWLALHSVEDDEVPEQPNILRAQILQNVFFLKPNPEIRGYTIITDAEFNIGGPLPNSLVQSASLSKTLKNWMNFSKLIERDVKIRLQKEQQVAGAQDDEQIVS